MGARQSRQRKCKRRARELVLGRRQLEWKIQLESFHGGNALCGSGVLEFDFQGRKLKIYISLIKEEAFSPKK
jgi:hypothetical protein